MLARVNTFLAEARKHNTSFNMAIIDGSFQAPHISCWDRSGRRALPYYRKDTHKSGTQPLSTAFGATVFGLRLLESRTLSDKRFPTTNEL